MALAAPATTLTSDRDEIDCGGFGLGQPRQAPLASPSLGRMFAKSPKSVYGSHGLRFGHAPDLSLRSPPLPRQLDNPEWGWAYRADRKTFPFWSGIWLADDYEFAAR
jgi:hypothetical protein